MSTSKVNLSTDEYVRVNNKLNPLVLQAHRDSVRITLSEERPVKNNSVFHLLGADKDPLIFQSIDTNVWALAMTDESSLIVTETDSVKIIPTGEYLTEVSRGLVEGHRIIHKFGHGNVGTTPSPVTSSGFWRTPTIPVQLEFVSDNVADAVGGAAATKIVIQGIDENWDEITQEIETNGLTPVTIPLKLIRLHRWYVSESGTYADETSVSHAGTLTIQVSGGGDIWDTIEGASPFPAQSEIGVATIPIGYTAFILSKHIFTDTAKVADVYFMQRPFADDVVTPFKGARRIIERDIGVTGGYNIVHSAPKGPYVGPCDLGFMGKVSVGTAEISVEFELLIIKDGF